MREKVPIEYQALVSFAKRGKSSFLCQPRENTFDQVPELSLKVGAPVLVVDIAFLCSWNKRKYDQWWEVKFVGEGIIDQVG